MKIHNFWYIICFLILSLLVFPVTGCDSRDATQGDYTGKDIFSIYLLSERVEGEPPYDLDGFQLPEKPWLSIEDIDYYDFSTHYIYLKTDKASFFGEDWQIATPSAFMVIAGGERCYLGHFHSLVMSWLPQTPTISFDPAFNPGLDFYPDDVIHIEKCGLDGSEDVRNDRRIKEALSKAGKLSSGVSVMLNDVKVNSHGGTTDVSYTFTVTNEGDEALYMFDPDKTGVDLFHYFAGGLYLYGSEVYVIVLSAYDSTVQPYSYENPDVSWFTRLNRHKSMERTLTFDSDDIVSEGAYSCRVGYTGPSRIEKNDRVRSDGRLWIGAVESNPVEITVHD